MLHMVCYLLAVDMSLMVGYSPCILLVAALVSGTDGTPNVFRKPFHFIDPYIYIYHLIKYVFITFISELSQCILNNELILL